MAFGIGEALGVGGLLLNFLQGKEAGRTANRSVDAQQRAIDLQAPLIEALVALQKRLNTRVQSASDAGYFDPESRRQALLRNLSDLEKRSMRDEAASSRVAGYDPRDSVSRESRGALLAALRRQAARAVEDDRLGLLGQELGAWAATRPDLNANAAGLIQQGYGSLSNALGAHSQAMYSRLGDPLAGLAALIQYQNARRNQGQGQGGGDGFSLLHMPGGRDGSIA